MDDMMQKLEDLIQLCQKENLVLRFHSLKSPATQDAAIPWKLDLDVKEPMVRHAFLSMVLRVYGNWSPSE